MDPPTSSSIPSDTMTFLAALLDTSSPTTDQVFKTSMSLSTDPATSSGSAASIEPLPHINYLLLNNLIALAKPHLSARRLKRMDYLVDARRGFYDSHVKFAIAYRDLSDTTAAGDLLDKKADELKKRLADAQGQHDEATAATVKRELDAVQAQRMANNEEMRIRLQALNERTRCRQHTAAWFSEFKTVFLRDEMPWLVELGKESYRSAMEQQQQQGTYLILTFFYLHGTFTLKTCTCQAYAIHIATKSGATAPSSSSATATPVSPAVKKLMEKVEADSGGVRVGAGIANDMGGEPSTSMAMQQEQGT